MKVFLLALAALCFSVAAYAGEADPFRKAVVEVRSTYADGVTGKRHAVRGTGFLVEHDRRYYVVTASHVSQGQALAIPSLTIKGRLANCAEDIEVIEVERPEDASFFAFDQREPRERRYVVHQGGAPSSLAMSGPQFLKTSELTSAFVPEWVSTQETVAWKVPRAHSPDHSRRESLFHMDTGIAEDVLTSRSKIAPGMSGSPLLERRADGAVALAGVTLSYVREFDRSYFAPIGLVGQLIKRYRQGERGRVDATEWHMRNGLTYRKFDSELFEIVPFAAPAGGGVSGDGGGGVSGDGGESREKTSRPADPWKEYSIEPGMQLKGEPIIAFRLKPKRPSWPEVNLYANSAAVTFIRKYAADYDVEPVRSSVSFSELFQAKLRQKESHVLLYAEVDSTHQLGCWGDQRPRNKDWIEFSSGRVKVRKALCDGDFLSFELDDRGRLVGSKDQGFKPIIRVAGIKSGKEYAVDLRDLYFVDLSVAVLGSETSDTGLASGNPLEDLWKQNYEHELRIRDVSEGNEYFTHFEPSYATNRLEFLPLKNGRLVLKELETIDQLPCQVDMIRR